MCFPTNLCSKITTNVGDSPGNNHGGNGGGGGGGVGGIELTCGDFNPSSPNHFNR